MIRALDEGFYVIKRNKFGVTPQKDLLKISIVCLRVWHVMSKFNIDDA